MVTRYRKNLKNFWTDCATQSALSLTSTKLRKHIGSFGVANRWEAVFAFVCCLIINPQKAFSDKSAKPKAQKIKSITFDLLDFMGLGD